ncbi:MAG: hypothetical protein U5K77_00790 [Candidatus Saccharibacteria bacterium]|nr:hypothetical protein [Candidatus Saccharibacteria bacterium]
MNKIASKIKPRGGFAHVLYVAFNILIPVVMYVLMQWGLVMLALAVVLLAKWRMLAVQPRHWWPNIRANAVDIIVGLAILGFMTQTGSSGMQALFALLYGIWLIVLKPKADILSVSLQAFVAHTFGLIAIFSVWGSAPTGVMVLSAGVVGYVCARHFFTSFDERHTPLYAHTWGYFCAALVWILSHWLLFYNFLPQPALLLTVLGFGLAGLYYLEQTDRLSILLRRQFMFIMVAIVVVVLAFSDWGDKAI